MDYVFLTGLLGSLVLVTGAAWPDRKHIKHPVYSAKNWLFAVGGLIMLLFAVLGYIQGGPIFFIILEILVAIASVMMMLNVPDKYDVPIISLSGLGLVIWSLTLFEGYNTVIFVVGLTAVGLGYALKMGTVRRSFALMFGSALIAVFSYIEQSWIFFGLNFFFALFSGFYVVRGLLRK